MSVFDRNGARTERPVEGFLHGVLKSAGVVRRQRVALRIGPFVHIEPMNVLAGNAPFFEEIDSPAIHAHRPDGENQGKGPTRLACELDLTGNLVP
jgi:hypothetical protein